MERQVAAKELMETDKTAENFCPLCERSGCIMTDHHLIPVHKGGKAEHKVSLCKECHKQIHAIYTNDDLAIFYNTIDKLKAASDLQSFYKFIKKQNPYKVIKVKQSKRRRGKN